MNPNRELKKKNWRRRLFGLLLALAPMVALLVSIRAGLSESVENGARSGVVFMLLAAAVAVFNFWLSFVRPIVYRWRHGGMTGFKFVSGVPGIGTVLVAIAIPLSFGFVWIGILGLAVLLVDTGGLPWFVWSTWRDESLWDA
jgi:hypothetical protein